MALEASQNRLLFDCSPRVSTIYLRIPVVNCPTQNAGSGAVLNRRTSPAPSHQVRSGPTIDGKIVDPGCTTKSAFLHSETSWIFWIFRYRSQYFNTIPVNLDKFLQFLKNPRNSDQFSSSLSINIVKFAEKTRFFEKKSLKMTKIYTSFCWFFEVLSGAKVWWSCRSRKMLKNAPILAIWGVDTAENEPFS